MTVVWTQDSGVWYLNCDNPSCSRLIACTHTYDHMTTGSADDLQITSGKTCLPMSGEFPDIALRLNDQLTIEKLGFFDVLVSEPINSYGTRKVQIATKGDPVFLMMLNPEDAIVSIYQAVHEFVNTQVSYTDGDRFGSCKGSSHKIGMQQELDALSMLADVYPMLEFWDKLSKLTTGSCVVCMWKRSQVVPADANASGLGSLDLMVADEKQTATGMFMQAIDDAFADDQRLLAHWTGITRF